MTRSKKDTTGYPLFAKGQASFAPWSHHRRLGARRDNPRSHSGSTLYCPSGFFIRSNPWSDITIGAMRTYTGS